MRVSSFAGFLSSYVRKLSGKNTLSLYQLANDAATVNPRLCEPLFLYALMNDKIGALLHAAKNKKLHDEYCGMSAKYNKSSMVEALKNNADDMRHEYRKVYRSYLSIANKFQNEAHTKALMRNKITGLQSKKNVSTYRLHKDLEINQGNLNAYLSNGNMGKVSLHTARRVLKYLSDD